MKLEGKNILVEHSILKAPGDWRGPNKSNISRQVLSKLDETPLNVEIEQRKCLSDFQRNIQLQILIVRGLQGPDHERKTDDENHDS